MLKSLAAFLFLLSVFTVYAGESRDSMPPNATVVGPFWGSDSLFEHYGRYGVVSANHEELIHARYEKIAIIPPTLRGRYFLGYFKGEEECTLIDSNYKELLPWSQYKVSLFGSIPLKNGDIKDLFLLENKDGFGMFTVTDDYHHHETATCYRNFRLFQRDGEWWYSYETLNGTSEETVEDEPRVPYDSQAEKRRDLILSIVRNIIYFSPWLFLFIVHRKQKKRLAKHVLVCLASTAIMVLTLYIATINHEPKGFLDFSLLPLFIITGAGYLAWMLIYVVVSIRKKPKL